MKTAAKNISEFFKTCVSYGIAKGKLNLLTTDQTLGFCTVPVVTPSGVSLHPFRGSSVCTGLMVWGTQKQRFSKDLGYYIYCLMM